MRNNFPPRAAAKEPRLQMNPVATIDEAVDMVRRRAPLILGVLILGFLVSSWLGLGQRPVYEAREILQVAPPRVAEAMASTSVPETIVQRLPLLKQHVLGDTALSEIASAYDLFRIPPGEPLASRTELLRDAVSLNWKTAPDGQVEVVATARMDDAEEARLVAGELGHRLVNLSVQMRIGEARATLDFLTRREAELSEDLSRLETRYTNFLRAAPAVPEPGTPEAELDENGTAHLLAEMNRYQRELARLRGQLEETATQRARARIGLDLEMRRQSERLVVSAPAERPVRPVTDVRGLIVGLGGVVSAILAFGLAWTLEWFNPVIRSAEQMQRMTGIMPIVSVPHATRSSRHGAIRAWRWPRNWPRRRAATAAAG